jgi:hypothetical protein
MIKKTIRTASLEIKYKQKTKKTIRRAATEENLVIGQQFNIKSAGCNGHCVSAKLA